MKPIIFPALLFLVSFSACAQSSNLDKFYQKYQASQQSDKDGISISPSLLLNISFSGNDAASSDDWFHKISFLHCLTIAADQAREWSDLTRSLSKDDFEEWVSVRRGKGKLQLLSHDGRNGLEDIVCVIVNEEGKGMFFHVRGRLSARDKEHIRSAFQEKITAEGSN
jgi:hypothetical protein